jgi:hypothetical protein
MYKFDNNVSYYNITEAIVHDKEKGSIYNSLS